MHNLPSEIKRHIFKLMLDENPLEIFNFSKEMFKIGEYTKKEKRSLIIDCIEKSFEIFKIPLFNFKNESKNYEIYKTKNFMSILYSIKRLINDDNIKLFCNKYTFFFIDESIAEILNLKIFKFIYSINPSIFITRSFMSLLNYSISSNNLKIIKWIHYKNLHILDELDFCLNEAIENNNLKLIKYFINNCFNIDSDCYSIAIANNNFKIVKLLYKKGIKIEENNIISAIKNNNLEMAIWLYDKDKNLNVINEWCFYHAILKDSLQILDWLKSITIDYFDREDLYKVVVDKGNFAILDWFLQNYPSLCDKNKLYKIAIKNGNLKMADYIQSTIN